MTDMDSGHLNHEEPLASWWMTSHTVTYPEGDALVAETVDVVFETTKEHMESSTNEQAAGTPLSVEETQRNNREEVFHNSVNGLQHFVIHTVQYAIQNKLDKSELFSEDDLGCECVYETDGRAPV